MFKPILWTSWKNIKAVYYFLLKPQFCSSEFNFLIVNWCVFSLKASKLPMSIIIVGVGPAEFDGKW